MSWVINCDVKVFNCNSLNVGDNVGMVIDSEVEVHTEQNELKYIEPRPP